MRLRCLVGAYADQVLNYSDAVGKQLLASGRAEPVEESSESEIEQLVTPRGEEHWTMKMTPTHYLNRWPKGVNADLARRLIGC